MPYSLSTAKNKKRCCGKITGFSSCRSCQRGGGTKAVCWVQVVPIDNFKYSGKKAGPS